MKTALIFTGGTIGSAVTDEYISLSADRKYELIKDYDTADFDIFEPYTILSENLNGEHITLLLRQINDCLDSGLYNGVIVMHGTDTLLCSAAAVSYAFGIDTVPVIFVSSNYVLSDNRANGRNNFSCALDFVRHADGRGTFISYKNEGENTKIHRAARVLDYRQYSDCLCSLGGEYGHYENGVFVKNDLYRESMDKTEPFGIFDFNKCTVLHLRACPGVDSRAFSAADAVLLETYHSGTVSEELLRKTDKPVFILGTENRIQYESVKVYDRENVTLIKKAAASAVYVKLRAALALGRVHDINLPLGGDMI